MNVLGFTIPILVNRKNNVIIAGHQRTKAATALGIKEVPAIMIDNVSYGDEIKFNQLHNGVDVQRGFKGRLCADVDSSELDRFIEIAPEKFDLQNTGAVYVKEICSLILKYGNVFSCVICDNDIIVGVNYIKACQVLNYKANSYIISSDKYADAMHYLKSDYGQYSYDEIKRNTYVQGLAQLDRSVEKKEGKKAQHSSLYENMVLPYLASHEKVHSILDFGCGKGAYINSLKKSYRAIGVEFYNNNRSSINVSKGNRQIDDLISYLREKKTFDVVICDSVLNSVDSVEAENSVIACLNLFSIEKLFISGRPLDSVISKLRMLKDASSDKRYVEYLDNNNFTGNYRAGNWYFQHFHSKEGAEKLLEYGGFRIDKMTWRKYGDSFQIEATKIRELTKEQYAAAVDFEFNLPLPNGKSYCRHDDVKRVLNLI